METQTPTPYQEALLQVRRRLEAAQRGETPLPVQEVVEEKPILASPGQPAPDFVTTLVSGGGSVRLKSWMGRPILLVFYRPTSPIVEPLLNYIHILARTYTGRLVVLLMSVSDDPGSALRLSKALNLDLPILNGSGLRISYGIEATPKMVLIDASGILRGSFLGWGQQTPSELVEELKTWLHVPAVPPPGAIGTGPPLDQPSPARNEEKPITEVPPPPILGRVGTGLPITPKPWPQGPGFK